MSNATSSTTTEKGKTLHQRSNANNESVPSSGNITISAIITNIQRPLDTTFASEYSFSSISHVYRSTTSINRLLLHQQNRPYPGNGTDVVFQCSNGYIRAHSLLMTSSSLIDGTLKENECLDHHGNRSIAVNGYKVEHIAKILFLFYAGQVIFTMENEKKIILRLLEIFGVNSSSIIVDVPFLYSDGYKQLLQKKMKGLQLRMVLTTTKVNRNNEKQEDEIFIRPNGSIEPLSREWNVSEVIALDDVPNGFYCATCEFIFDDIGNLQTHMLNEHGVQPNKSINHERHSTVQQNSEIHISTTTQVDPCQPGTSAALRKELALLRTAPVHEKSLEKRRKVITQRTPQNSPVSQADVEIIIINSPNATSTPSPTKGPGTSCGIRPIPSQEIDQQNQKYLSCAVCFLVRDNDKDMQKHLINCHSRTLDENGQYLGVACRTENPDAFKGTRCLICNEKYLKATALKQHYEKLHEVIEGKHYTLPGSPKCLVCQQKIGHDRKDGEDATQFFNHVRQCLTGKNNTTSTKSRLPMPKNDFENKKPPNRKILTPPGKPKPSVPKWSTAKRMGTVVADVIQEQPSAKRKLSVRTIPERIPTREPAPQQKKKKKLETNQQLAAMNHIVTTPVRVLRSGRNIPEVPEKGKKASKIPKMQVRNSQLPTDVAAEEPMNELRVTNLRSIPKGKQKATMQKLAPKEKLPVRKKAVNTGRGKNKKAEAIVQPNQSNEKDGEDNSDIIVLVEENPRFRKLPIPNRHDEDKENAGNYCKPLVPGSSKSVADCLSSGSLVPGTPNYNSTHILDVADLNKQRSSVMIPKLRVKKVPENVPNVDAWVCTAADDAFTPEIVTEIPPEDQRSGISSMYTTPEQTLQFLSVSDNKIDENINRSEFDHFQEFSDTGIAKINEAACEYAQLIQNHQDSLPPLDRTNYTEAHPMTWFLDFPVDISTIFSM